MGNHQPEIERFLAPDEGLLLLTETDITRGDRFGRRWLAVTDRRIMTFAETDDGPELAVRLEDVRSAQAEHLVGRVALHVETDGRRVEVARGSNSQASKFSRIARALTEARKEGRAPEFELGEEERTRCPHCGRLLPEKGGFCPACLKKWEVASRFWQYVRPHWPLLALLSALIMGGTAVGVVPPLLVRTLVDDVLKGEGGMPLLALLVAALVGLSLAGVLLTIVRGRLAARVGSKVVHEIRFDLYQAIQRLTLRRYDKSQTGSLISRLTHDTERVNFFLIEVGAYFVPELLLLVGILVMMFWLNWRLALLVLIPAPAVLLATAWFYRRLRRLYHRYWQRRAIMTARATDSISGIRVVKAFSQEPREIDEFRWRSSSFADSAATAEAMWATGAPIIHFLMGTGTFMVWYFGGRALLRGEPGMTLGTLMAFLHYLALFYGPLRMLTGFSDFMNRALTAAQRLFEITDAEQEVYEAPDARPLPQPEGAFSLRGVHFSYTKDKPVLKGLTLEVRPGEMIGLVGKSGAGKTTMCNLICRFYDVDEGAICLDGVDLRKLRLRDLRRHIGIVPQESFLFNGSIAENIGYASPETTRPDIIRAAIAANAHGFIMRLPDGYDTRVGERGARLSGGEKQRIAIARAILHNPKVLILDEATSSVDTETEALIQEALSRLVEGRTTFAIAHRLSTLRNSDRLLVIEDGKCAEVGSHSELMEQRGTYRRLVEMQSELSSITALGG